MVVTSHTAVKRSHILETPVVGHVSKILLLTGKLMASKFYPAIFWAPYLPFSF